MTNKHGKCKTCKWWRMHDDDGNPYSTYLTHPFDPDTFEPMDVHEVRYCDSPKLSRLERPTESDWAAVIDGSEYYAALVTGADFGCVNWEGE